jgi:HEAT repeat protein
MGKQSIINTLKYNSIGGNMNTLADRNNDITPLKADDFSYGREGFFRRLVDWDRSPVVSAVRHVSHRISEIAERAFHMKVRRLLSAGKTEEIAGLGRKALVDLYLAIDQAEPQIRWNAVEALGNMPSQFTTARLVRCLEDGDEIVRAKAVEALGKTSDYHMARYLARATHDPDEVVRACADEALLSLKEGIRRSREEKKEVRQRMLGNTAMAYGRTVDQRIETIQRAKSVIEDTLTKADAKLKIVDLEIQRRKERLDSDRAAMRKKLLGKATLRS